jgi:acetylglutamate/LysW-gamma-L-alpha-aminoadipate kinase
VIDGGYTGQLKKVNTDLLKTLLDKGYTPVVAPIATGEEFEPLNVDGDRVAAYVSGALIADRLILLTDVEGVILDGKVKPKLTSRDVKKTLQNIGPGMITKMYAALEALEMGVREVIIASGFVNMPITSALEHNNGTVILNE